MKTTLRPEQRTTRGERAFEMAIAAFLWAFRIILVLVVVIGSTLTIASGKYGIDVWADLVVQGAVQGGIYASVAIGYTMVYGIMRMINFAHGEVFMIGVVSGYFTATILDDLGLLNANPLISVISFLLMLLVAATMSTLVALAVERVAYRPLRNSPRLVLLISAIGASFFLQYSIAGLIGSKFYRYPTIEIFQETVPVLGLKWIDVIVIASALAMMGVLYTFVMRSKQGTAIRAVSEDKQTAALMGINVDRAIVVTFGVGHLQLLRRVLPRHQRPSRPRSSAASATSPAPWSAASCSARPSPSAPCSSWTVWGCPLRVSSRTSSRSPSS
jgi:branched-chain amino acid transport system permease protein